MKKLLIVLILFILIQGELYSQSCLAEGIIFSNQSQIDNFKINYPGCSEIQGDVLVSGADISNFYGLDELASIGGGLIIKNNDILTNLFGFDILYQVGYLDIEDNPSLIRLEGIDDLYYINDFLLIRNNPALISIAGPGNLHSIGGYLSIDSNQVLTSIYPLINLTSIGGGAHNGDIFIHHNPALANLSGLDNINPGSIDNLHIYSNPLLSNCDLASICGYLASPNGVIEIHDNNIGCNSQEEVTVDCSDNCLPAGIQIFTQEDLDSLRLKYPDCHEIMGKVFIDNYFDDDITNLNALSDVTSIGGYLYIGHCAHLTSLAGLENMTFIGGALFIDGNNALTDMTGVENIDTLWGGLQLDGNLNMTSLSGLENLTYIGSHLIISYNISLKSLSPLNHVTTIGSWLDIYGNDSLTSLSGLDNIGGGSITELYISDNAALSECAVKSICDYLSIPGGDTHIENNAPGCNTYVEVAVACGYTSTEDPSPGASFSLSPNPANAYLNIQLHSISPTKNVIIAIYNINGQQVLTRKITEPQASIDLSDLQKGMYVVKVVMDDAVMVGKFVKE